VKARTVRLFVVGAAAILAVVLAISYRRVPRPPGRGAGTAPLPGPTSAGSPTTLASGFDYTESTAGKPRFRVQARRTAAFSHGPGQPSTYYALEKVGLTLYGDDGPTVVHADRADYDPATSAAHLEGRVVVTDPKGATLKSTRLELQPRANVIVMPAPVDLAMGGLTAHASSGRYDVESGIAEFAGPVSAVGAPGTAFSSGTAQRAVLRRKESVLELSGQVDAARGPDRIRADTVVLHLGPGDRVESANAAGAVTAVFAPPAGSKQPPRTVTGTSALLRFSPAGELVASEVEGSPARLESPPRWVTAPHVSGTHSGGELTRVVLTGGVEGDGPEGKGRAPTAEYDPRAGNTILLAGTGDAELQSPRGQLLARRIEIAGEPPVVRAIGTARAFLHGGSASPGLPGFLSSSRQPTRGKADEIVLDDGRRTATLSGSAGLWQGGDLLVADRVELDDAKKCAVATGSVRVVGLARGKKSSEPYAATAARMRYEESRRVATFEDRVVMTRGGSRAEGERAEAHFDADKKIERTRIWGHVRFQDSSTGRSGTGDWAEDDPRAGKTILGGAPAVALDAHGGRVAGSILTFERESGTVRVQPGDGGRIETVYPTH
jgi:lipopolysaccharide export system protein LptA